MRVLVTGAAGFIGSIVSKALLDDPNDEVILTDIIEPTIPKDSAYPQNGKVIKADLLESARELAAMKPDACLMLHGIMSSGAEANFEFGYRVNVDATKALLFELADVVPGVRVIYASSIAVYGTPHPRNNLTESVPTTPESSYGCQKIICETYINDLTRRGKIDGFALRFPGVTVRAGAPAAAASSFLSGIIREPLNGETCVVPMIDRNWRTWISSPDTLVKNIIVATNLPRDALPPHRRVVLVPGFEVTIQGMIDALEEVGGKDKVDLVKLEDNKELKPLFDSWPETYDNALGLSLGMVADKSFVDVVRQYSKTLRKRG
jgi:nucleoside-diphosphate-sugar epimerase